MADQENPEQVSEAQGEVTPADPISQENTEAQAEGQTEEQTKNEGEGSGTINEDTAGNADEPPAVETNNEDGDDGEKPVEEQPQEGESGEEKPVEGGDGEKGDKEAGATEEQKEDEGQTEQVNSDEIPKESSRPQSQGADGETEKELIATSAENTNTTTDDTEQGIELGEANTQSLEPSTEETEGEAPKEGENQAKEGEETGQAETATEEGGDAKATDEEAKEGEAEQASEDAPASEAAEGETEQATSAGMEGIPEGDEEAAEKEEIQSPVPQFDTFADGEKTESLQPVGEKLSREGTPTGEEDTQLVQERTMSPPVPGTPDRASLQGSEEEEEDEDEEEEEYEEPQFDRDQLIERYHQALGERQQLQEQNYQLQHKLAEYFRKKKADERQDMDKNVTDQEQRYLKYMANLDELRRQDTDERESFKQQIEEMKERCEDKQKRVDDERIKFMEFKKQIAHSSVNSRSGKPIPAKDIEQHFMNESRKEEEVVKVRLENIKLKNKLKKKEAQLKSKEELAEGLHMIDFEQLKIENQTYNEKIEERNEELLKLRKKITSTVQVLTHLKEKLQFVQGENGTLKVTLRDVEELAAKKRDILSRTKQARDGLRIDNQRLRQNCGLLGNEPLLRDFEERKDESDDLTDKLEQLKMQHAELTLNLNGVRRKIQQAQVGR